MKKEAGVAENQSQCLNKYFKPNEKEKPEITDESNLIYDNKSSFIKYRNYKKYNGLSFMTKYDKLFSFYHWLNDFRNFAPGTVKAKIKKKIVCIKLL